MSCLTLGIQFYSIFRWFWLPNKFSGTVAVIALVLLLDCQTRAKVLSHHIQVGYLTRWLEVAVFEICHISFPFSIY